MKKRKQSLFTVHDSTKSNNTWNIHLISNIYILCIYTKSIVYKKTYMFKSEIQTGLTRFKENQWYFVHIVPCTTHYARRISLKITAFGAHERRIRRKEEIEATDSAFKASRIRGGAAFGSRGEPFESHRHIAIGRVRLAPLLWGPHGPINIEFLFWMGKRTIGRCRASLAHTKSALLY